jgi:hypothetical protein
VTDESGALLASARVSFRNVDTGLATATVTNESGLYFLGEVRPGSYELRVEAPGFTRYVQTGITVRIEDRLRADVSLKVGQITETVEVTSQAPLIQTESNTIGRVVEENTIKQLPLRGRNAFELVLLSPGAEQRGDDELPRLSGGRARSGEYVLDGSSTTTPRRGQLFTQPNLDAIQEFKVQTSGLSAGFGAFRATASMRRRSFPPRPRSCPAPMGRASPSIRRSKTPASAHSSSGISIFSTRSGRSCCRAPTSAAWDGTC